jgi:hypothetical protein
MDVYDYFLYELPGDYSFRMETCSNVSFWNELCLVSFLLLFYVNIVTLTFNPYPANVENMVSS